MENRVNGNKIIPYSGPAKRAYKRIKRHFMAKLQSRLPDAEGKTSVNWDMVSICDLGAGGTLFNYDKRLEIGSLLNLEIKFPPSEKPIRSVVKILRVEEPFKASILHIATVFVEIDKEQKEIINKAAEGFYSKH